MDSMAARTAFWSTTCRGARLLPNWLAVLRLHSHLIEAMGRTKIRQAVHELLVYLEQVIRRASLSTGGVSAALAQPSGSQHPSSRPRRQADADVIDPGSSATPAMSSMGVVSRPTTGSMKLGMGVNHGHSTTVTLLQTAGE